MEYELPSIPNAGPPVFMFVVDVCNHEDELKELADSLTQALNLLPEDSLVGFISYGANVNVYELGFDTCSTVLLVRLPPFSALEICSRVRSLAWSFEKW